MMDEHGCLLALAAAPPLPHAIATTPFLEPPCFGGFATQGKATPKLVSFAIRDENDPWTLKWTPNSSNVVEETRNRTVILDSTVELYSLE